MVCLHPQAPAFHSLGIYLEVELLDHMLIVCFCCYCFVFGRGLTNAR
jgi:hypothetical protein